MSPLSSISEEARVNAPLQAGLSFYFRTHENRVIFFDSPRLMMRVYRYSGYIHLFVAAACPIFKTSNFKDRVLYFYILYILEIEVEIV